MNLKQVASNVTELKLNDWYVLFSYQTPVLAVDRKNGSVFQTEKFWSKTTSRHINTYLKDRGVIWSYKKPQAFFDNLISSCEVA